MGVWLWSTWSCVEKREKKELRGEEGQKGFFLGILETCVVIEIMHKTAKSQLKAHQFLSLPFFHFIFFIFSSILITYFFVNFLSHRNRKADFILLNPIPLQLPQAKAWNKTLINIIPNQKLINFNHCLSAFKSYKLL